MNQFEINSEKIGNSIINFIRGALVTIGVITILIGLLPLVFDLLFNYSNNSFKKNAVVTTAKIISIDVIDEWTTPTVEFYINEEKYVGELNQYDSSMYVGKEVTIYYDPLNPKDFRGAGTSLDSSLMFSIIPIFIGGFFIVINVVIGREVKKAYKNVARKKELIDNNYAIEANIIGIRTVEDMENIYIMEAYYENPTDGNRYHFKSEFFRFDAVPIIEHYNMKTIPVYVNPADFTEYVVDLSKIKQFIDKM